MEKRGVKFKHFLLLIILFGIIIRLGVLFNANSGYDATYYIAMARGYSENGEFVMEWGDFGEDNVSSSTSHHFSPAFSFYMAVFYSLFGYDFLVIKIASVILSLLFLLTVYITTKSLYNNDKAIVVTAFFSVCYPLIWSTRSIYSENMVMIFFIITMWAIIKGIDDDRYMIWAGLFAGLGFLTKASIGYFFIIAGGLGFLWRFYYLRWDVFKKKYYLCAIFIFLTIVGLWSFRNMSHFGFLNWETSYWVKEATDFALDHPFGYLKYILYSAVTFLILFLTFAIFFPKELKSTIKNVKEEHYSGLWLAVFIVLLIGIFISGAFAMVEKVTVFTPDRIRYIIAAFIPLSWLIVKDTNFQIEKQLKLMNVKELLPWLKNILTNPKMMLIIIAILFVISVLFIILDYLTTPIIILAVGIFCFTIKSSRKRLLIILLVFLLISINIVTEVRYSGGENIAHDLKNYIDENETIAISTMNKYAIYPYLEEVNFNVSNYNDHDNSTNWIISNRIVFNSNFTLTKVYSSHDCQGIIFSVKDHFIRSNSEYQGELDFYLYKRRNSSH